LDDGKVEGKKEEKFKRPVRFSKPDRSEGKAKKHHHLLSRWFFKVK